MWTAAAGVPMAAAQGPGSGGGSAQGSTQAGSSTGATAGTSGMGDRDAQEGAGTTTSTQAPSNSANDLQQFVEKAAIANMAEIELGKLAAQQAQDPQVKQFAQMMVDEHTSALEQLRTVASSQGLQVASSLDSKHQKLQQKLSKLQGAEFDRAYMDAMVDAHKDAEKLLKRRAGNSGSESAANMAHSQGTAGTTGTSGTATGSDTSAAGASRPAGSASGTSATGTSGTPSSDTLTDHRDERQHGDRHAKRRNAGYDRDVGDVEQQPGRDGIGGHHDGAGQR